MKISKSLLLFAVVTLALTKFTFADDYKIDKVHSEAGFSVRHLTISNVKGRFTDLEGTITYDPKDITKSAVKVTTSASYSVCSHLRMIEVSSPPE